MFGYHGNNGYDPNTASMALKLGKKRIEDRVGRVHPRDEIDARYEYLPDSGQYKVVMGQHEEIVTV